MADAVSTRVLVDNQTTAIVMLTNISDGTGESLVAKVTPSTLAANALGQACTTVSVQKIHGACHGMEFRLYWGASTNVFFYGSAQNSEYTFDFSSFGGITNNAGTGKTGNILLSTADQSSGDTYTIILEMKKYYN
jgi:hypothetical protein